MKISVNKFVHICHGQVMTPRLPIHFLTYLCANYFAVCATKFSQLNSCFFRRKCASVASVVIYTCINGYLLAKCFENKNEKRLSSLAWYSLTSNSNLMHVIPFTIHLDSKSEVSYWILWIKVSISIIFALEIYTQKEHWWPLGYTGMQFWTTQNNGSILRMD